MKNLFVDLETTGLMENPDATVLSAGFLLDNVPEDEHPEILVVTICPTKEQFAKASPEALKVNGFDSYEKCQAEGVPLQDAVDTIFRWLHKNDVTTKTTRYIGQNYKFDHFFLRKIMPELEWLDFPYENSVDVIDLAKQLAKNDPSITFPNFKGWGISRALGVEEEGSLHLAIGGVESARRNYYALVKRLGKGQ